MTTIHTEGDRPPLCAHCGQKVVPGETCVVYIDRTADQTANVAKMFVHERCAPEFFGPGKVS